MHLSRAKILKTKQEILVGGQLVEATVHITALQLVHKPVCQVLYHAVFRI